MTGQRLGFSSRQLLFKELFVGTLIYAVVLGFFNDYTSLVWARSFSTIFMAAALLEVLTYLAFMLKGQILAWLQGRHGAGYRALRFFCIWLVLFLSKFVFIWALDLVLGEYIQVYGFFGILLVVASVTTVHKLADQLFGKLA